MSMRSTVIKVVIFGLVVQMAHIPIKLLSRALMFLKKLHKQLNRVLIIHLLQTQTLDGLVLVVLRRTHLGGFVDVQSLNVLKIHSVTLMKDVLNMS